MTSRNLEVLNRNAIHLGLPRGLVPGLAAEHEAVMPALFEAPALLADHSHRPTATLDRRDIGNHEQTKPDSLTHQATSRRMAAWRPAHSSRYAWCHSSKTSSEKIWSK